MNARPEATVAARGAVAVAAAALAAGTWVVASGPARFTTYAGRSWPAAALTVAVLASLTVAAVCGAGARRRAVISMPPLLVAIVWVAPVWAGWHGGSPVPRSVAFALGGFLVAAVVHTSLRSLGGGSSPAETALIAGAYVAALIAAAVIALIRDPYLDSGCLANCDVNVFLVSAHPAIADAAQQADHWLGAAIIIGALAVFARRLAVASPIRRRRLLPLAVALLLFAGATVVRAVLLQATPVEDPYDNRLFAAFVVTTCALVLLSAGLVADVVRRRREHHAIAATVADLGDTPAPGSLRSALADALGDPDLTVAYWLPDRGYWVDADGHEVDEPAAGSGAARLTRLARGNEEIAVVRHAGSSPDLADELGAAFLLGLENERLQAGVLAHLEEIRASRARIVETGDAERRRLERDLHDGAQQRLLALSYDLRLAHASAAPGSAAVTLLADAVEETKRALADLRDLAHGIYPATLAEIGLPAALETLAESAPLPVEVSAGATRRWTAAVESAAYFAAVEAVDDAHRRGASYVALRVDGDDDLLLLEASDDGSESDALPTVLVDRIVASGGQVVWNDRGLRMEIPCG